MSSTTPLVWDYIWHAWALPDPPHTARVRWLIWRDIEWLCCDIWPTPNSGLVLTDARLAKNQRWLCCTSQSRPELFGHLSLRWRLTTTPNVSWKHWSCFAHIDTVLRVMSLYWENIDQFVQIVTFFYKWNWEIWIECEHFMKMCGCVWGLHACHWLLWCFWGLQARHCFDVFGVYTRVITLMFCLCGCNYVHDCCATLTLYVACPRVCYECGQAFNFFFLFSVHQH
jgi:hypothetical protein